MKKILIILIITLGAFLRLFWLDKYPPGVTGDEIQQGYSAYSILKTGKDEWGDFLPIHPRGFGDYKPPFYTYLTIPFVGIFGLNVWGVRLPSAVAGIFTIMVVYFLAKQLFNSEKIGLVSSLLIAISPWSIQFSRVGFESNIGVLFFSMFVLFFLSSFKKNKFLILSAVFGGLGLFTYHSFKILTILFVLGLITIYRKELFKFDKKWLLIAVGIFSVSILIIVYGFVFSGAGRRASDAAIYSPEAISSLREIQVNDPLPQPWGRVINNRIFYIGSQFIQNYLGYFSLTFLFSPHRSDSTLFNLPGKGLFYIWELPLLLLGLYLVVSKQQKCKKIILLWLLLAPIPASLTRDFMHTQRVQTFLPLLSIVPAYGLAVALSSIPKRYVAVAVSIIGIIVIWSIIGRVDHYSYHMFRQNLGGLKYGYKEIVAYTEQEKNKYDKILFTKVHSEPQAFVAFYSKMDPNKFQTYSQNWKYFEKEFKFLDMINYSLDKYEFRNIDWEKDKKLKNTLIISSDQEIPDEVKGNLEIKDFKGKLIFIAVDTNNLR